MTIITSVFRQLWILGPLVGRMARALRTHAETIRWRRRILRALDQRRRG